MNRRNALLVGAGAAAGAAGLALAWRQQRRGDAAAASVEALASAPASASASASIWSLSFETLQGPRLAMQGLRGRPLLLNFWATWCAPCVTELPLLDAFYREHAPRGWQVVGLAIDQPAPVREFLARHPVRFVVALGGAGSIDLARSLGNATGGLPFTAVFGRDGRIVDRKVGLVNADELAIWSRKAD